MWYRFPISSTFTAHRIHSSHIDFINMLISDEYNLLSSTSHNFSQFPNTFYHLGQIFSLPISISIQVWNKNGCNVPLWTFWCNLLRMLIFKLVMDFVTYFINTVHNLTCSYRNISDLSLRAGSTYSNSGGTIHSVTQAIKHGSYNARSLDYDICVLKVCIDEGTWTYNDTKKCIITLSLIFL
jgi:hypothetical protein